MSGDRFAGAWHDALRQLVRGVEDIAFPTPDDARRALAKLRAAGYDWVQDGRWVSAPGIEHRAGF